jgi:hypothetical protein
LGWVGTVVAVKFKREAVASERAGLNQEVNCKTTILQILTELISLAVACLAVVDVWSTKKPAERSWKTRATA